MFEELDIDALIAKDKERDAIAKEFGKHGGNEQLMAELRMETARSSVIENVASVDRVDGRFADLSDDKSIISDILSDVADKLELEESLNKPAEEIQEAVLEDIEGVIADVESEVIKPVVDEVKENKREEELARANAEKDAMIAMMFGKIQEMENAQKESKLVKEPAKAEEHKKPLFSEDEIEAELKAELDKLQFADEAGAAKGIAKVLMKLTAAKEEKVVKQELSNEEFEQKFAAYNAKQYEAKFEESKSRFFQSDDGKKILDDDDLFDVYKAKLNRLQKSGEHLNPDDLFKNAYEKTATALGFSKPVVSNSMANKVVPKVASSLREDVSRAEEAKKQAVKPSSSSNTGNTTEGKKFNIDDYYSQMLAAQGRKIL